MLEKKCTNFMPALLFETALQNISNRKTRSKLKMITITQVSPQPLPNHHFKFEIANHVMKQARWVKIEFEHPCVLNVELLRSQKPGENW